MSSLKKIRNSTKGRLFRSTGEILTKEFKILMS